MPVLDTVVLFGALDKEDEHHEASVAHMRKLLPEVNDYWIAGFALFEFDVVMKSRGLSSDERIENYALLLKDFPGVSEKTLKIGPGTLLLTAELEKNQGIDYFDAGVASESLQKNGIVVSTDRVFDKIPNLKRIW